MKESSSEELELAHLYEKAPIGLCVTDTQHRYIRINQLLCDINGKSLEEHIGHTLHEVIPHVADQIAPIFQSVIDSAEPVLGLEVRGHTAAYPDEERIFLGDHYPLLSKGGKVLYVHTIVRDITEQRRAETLLKEANEELEIRIKKRTAKLESLSIRLKAETVDRRLAEETARSSEKGLRFLLESTHVIPWEANAGTWIFTYVGPQVERFGYPADRWLEQNFWVNHIHPEDREEAVNTCLTNTRLGESFDFEYRMIASDGRVIWIHDHVSVESSDKEETVIRGFMIDISQRKNAHIELKKSEEMFRYLLQASPEGVAIVGQRGVILRVNEQMENMFGYASKELEGSPIEQLVPNNIRDQHQGHRSKYSQNSTARPMGDVPDLYGQRKDGSLFPVDICLAPLTLEGEDVSACFVRDITTRKQYEEEARLNQGTLARISRITAMGELVGSIAHELNQPLAAILSNAQAALQFMKAGNPDLREIQEIFYDIEQDDLRANQIIQRLRALLQKQSVAKESIQLNNLINELLPLFRSDAIAAKINIDIESTPNLPPVEADPIQIQQIIINLLMNGIDAIRSTESDGGNLRVAVSSIQGDSIRIAIRDDGPGISTENINDVFTPFFTTKSLGMGVGLSICRTIVEAHGGTISVENLKPRGCCFSFTLPLKST